MIEMSWLTALIAVALLVWLLIAFPRFRIIALFVIAGLALLVFLMVRVHTHLRTRRMTLAHLPSENTRRPCDFTMHVGT